MKKKYVDSITKKEDSYKMKQPMLFVKSSLLSLTPSKHGVLTGVTGAEGGGMMMYPVIIV